MSLPVRATLLSDDPAAVLALLGAAATDVVVVEDARDVPATGGALVVSGAPDPRALDAALHASWDELHLDVSRPVADATLDALRSLGTDGSAALGELRTVRLVQGGAALDRRLVAALPDLLAVPASASPADGGDDDDDKVADLARRLEQAKRARRRAEQRERRLRRSPAVRVHAALAGVGRRVPGGTRALLVLAALVAVALVVVAALLPPRATLVLLVVLVGVTLATAALAVLAATRTQGTVRALGDQLPGDGREWSRRLARDLRAVRTESSRVHERVRWLETEVAELRATLGAPAGPDAPSSGDTLSR